MYRSSTGKLERWFNPDWLDINRIPHTPVDLPQLKQVGGLPVCGVVCVCGGGGGGGGGSVAGGA